MITKFLQVHRAVIEKIYGIETINDGEDNPVSVTTRLALQGGTKSDDQEEKVSYPCVSIVVKTPTENFGASFTGSDVYRVESTAFYSSFEKPVVYGFYYSIHVETEDFYTYTNLCQKIESIFGYSSDKRRYLLIDDMLFPLGLSSVTMDMLKDYSAVYELSIDVPVYMQDSTDTAELAIQGVKLNMTLKDIKGALNE